MQVGDRVFVTRSGDLRFLPQAAGDEDRQDSGDSTDDFVGVIQQLSDNPEDTIVAVEPAEPNMAPGRSTIATLREIYRR